MHSVNLHVHLHLQAVEIYILSSKQILSNKQNVSTRSITSTKREQKNNAEADFFAG